jgi:hypothetical protein
VRPVQVSKRVLLIEQDDGEGLAKRKGVAVRRGLKEACPERHGGNHVFVLIPDEEGLAWGCVWRLMGSGW